MINSAHSEIQTRSSLRLDLSIASSCNILVENREDPNNSRPSSRLKSKLGKLRQGMREFGSHFSNSVKTFITCSSVQECMTYARAKEGSSGLPSPSSSPQAGIQVTPSANQILPSSEQIKADVVNCRSKLDRELCEFVGRQRAQFLTSNFVRHWDFTILAAEENCDWAYNLRNAFQRHQQGIAVAGPWDIQLGDRVLERWDRMLKCSEVVVVLVSHALFRDRFLNACCIELLSRSTEKRVVPIYLDRMEDLDYPEGLQHLMMLQGLSAKRQPMKDLVQWLAPKSIQDLVLKRYLNEIIDLASLLRDIQWQPDAYI